MMILNALFDKSSQNKELARQLAQKTGSDANQIAVLRKKYIAYLEDIAKRLEQEQGKVELETQEVIEEINKKDEQRQAVLEQVDTHADNELARLKKAMLVGRTNTVPVNISDDTLEQQMAELESDSDYLHEQTDQSEENKANASYSETLAIVEKINKLMEIEGEYIDYFRQSDDTSADEGLVRLKEEITVDSTKTNTTPVNTLDESLEQQMARLEEESDDVPYNNALLLKTLANIAIHTMKLVAHIDNEKMTGNNVSYLDVKDITERWEKNIAWLTKIKGLYLSEEQARKLLESNIPGVGMLLGARDNMKKELEQNTADIASMGQVMEDKFHQLSKLEQIKIYTGVSKEAFAMQYRSVKNIISDWGKRMKNADKLTMQDINRVKQIVKDFVSSEAINVAIKACSEVTRSNIYI